MKSFKKYSVFTFLVLAAISGCKTHESVFPNSKISVCDTDTQLVLKGDRVQIPDSVSFGAVGIYSIDDSRCLLVKFNLPHHYSVYDFKTGESINLIHKGNGPAELLDAGVAGFRLNAAGEVELCAYDSNLQKGLFVNIDKSVKEKSTIVESTFNMPKNSMNMALLKDGLLCNVFFDENKVSYKLIDFDGNEKSVFKPYGDAEYLVTHSSEFFASIAVKPDETKFAMCMASMPIVNIVGFANGKSTAVVPYKGYDSEVATALANDSFKSDSYYVWSFPTDDNLYALSLTVNMETGDMYETLNVMDWNGSVSRSYRINDVLTNFYVKDNQLTGLTMNGEMYSYRIEL